MRGAGFCFGLSRWLGMPDDPHHIRAGDPHPPLHFINCTVDGHHALVRGKMAVVNDHKSRRCFPNPHIVNLDKPVYIPCRSRQRG